MSAVIELKKQAASLPSEVPAWDSRLVVVNVASYSEKPAQIPTALSAFEKGPALAVSRVEVICGGSSGGASG